MKISGDGKLIEELLEANSIDDDSYFVVGKQGMVKAKWKILVDSIKAKLGIADINKSISELNSSLKDNFGKTGGVALTNSSYYPTSYLYRSGQIVYMRCAGVTVKDVTAGSELVIAVADTIANEYLPNTNMVFYVIATVNGKRIRVAFQANGKITFTAHEDMVAGTGINIHICFHRGISIFS